TVTQKTQVILNSFQAADANISSLSTELPICAKYRLASKWLYFRNLPEPIDSFAKLPKICELHLRHDKLNEGGRKLLYVLARLSCVLLFPHSKITSVVASSSSTNLNQLGQVGYESGINITNDTAETDNNIV
ncbi:11769_t:CDS:2, partial [Gigaspora margarita]